MLRIIAGKYGKRLIEQPELETTRPTTDKIRESVFSSIQFDLKDKIVLDLFAGSGAWSIEALSRYAMKAVAVEKDKKAYEIIKKNIKNLDINNLEVWNSDVIYFLTKSGGKKFDFIFIDPPYDRKDLLNQSLETIKENDLLNKFGTIIIETNDENAIVIPKGFIINKSKKYGRVFVIFLSKFA
ncbi:16S rRNA (guanine(966)-N(2))-methyltransferase RsmD [Mycoplasma crocodyli]|uniref:Putative methyltransferase n=1 Tax=Mycoplasma crocodyli (strain ATCC 51981 / MP145) TaxID=512564 RepID=D5E4Q0_MYCCM|nr:16S rRNA (guanine(966)-N(2))-methyltransferase RsmD [Mycoplasma crocodyli]ADE20021.1 putative methyltransferase [Mycoplasma crocodyli MP145]